MDSARHIQDRLQHIGELERYLAVARQRFDGLHLELRSAEKELSGWSEKVNAAWCELRRHVEEQSRREKRDVTTCDCESCRALAEGIYNAVAYVKEQ